MPLWNITELEHIFNQKELQAVCDARTRSRPHPFGALLTEKESNPTSLTTAQALKLVAQKNKSWLTELKPRLLDVKDYSTASAALAELRAYGALLHVFNEKVQPVRTTSTSKTPDFVVKISQGTELYIEVHAKQWDEAEAKCLESFLVRPTIPNQGQNTAKGVRAIQPFGPPKIKNEKRRGEGTIENMISRIAAIKGGDKQIPPNALSLLWLDFQDYVWKFPLEDHLYPVISGLETISSGGFWHAFYGQKGMPLIQNGFIYNGLLGDIFEMQHEGRFYEQTSSGELAHRATGIMISLKGECVLFENPNAIIGVPSQFIVYVLGLPWFRLEKSWLNWPISTLKERIAYTRSMLRKLPDSIKDVIDPSCINP